MNKLRELKTLRKDNENLSEELDRVKEELEINNLVYSKSTARTLELITELETLKENWEKLYSEVENIQMEYYDLLQELKDMKQEMKQEMKQVSKKFRKQMK